MASNQRPGFIRDGESNARFGGDRDGESNDGQQLLRSIEKNKKVYEDATKSQTKFFRTMAEGVPVVGSLVKVINKGQKDLQDSMSGQSEAYKDAAKATYEYTKRVGVNSEELARVQSTLAKVQSKATELSKISKSRADIEKRISENSKGISVEGMKVSSNLSNVSELLVKTEKRLKNASDGEVKKKLESVVDDLKQLEKAKDLFKEINEELKDKELRNAVNSDEALKNIMGPLIDGVKANNKSIEEFAKAADQRTMGSVETFSNVLSAENNKLKGSMDKLGDSLSALGAAIVAGVGLAARREGMMVLQRQRLTGGTFSTAMRGEAVDFGVSEQVLLEAVSQNRYQLRRLGQNEGFAGARDFVESEVFDEMRNQAYNMGFMGEEALRYIMQTTDTLRRIGADSSVEAINSTLDFIKKTHKELGVSQEEMTEFLRDAMDEGMGLRLLAGDGGSLATAEAMQEEINLRGKLAKALNQDLEIQKRRMRMDSSLAFGDPVQALRQSVMGRISAQALGMSGQDAELIRRFTVSGGEGMADADREQALIARENLLIRAGGRLNQLAEMGDAGIAQRQVLLTFLQGFGFDSSEATAAFARTGGQEITAIDQVINRTVEPAENLGGLMSDLIGIVENIKGAFQNPLAVALMSVGGGALNVLGSLAEAVIMGAVARLGIRGAAKGALGAIGGAARGIWNFGRNAVRNPGRSARFALGKIALPVGAALGAYELSKVPGALNELEDSNDARRLSLFDAAGSAFNVVRRMEQQGLTELGGRTIEERRAQAESLRQEYIDTFGRFSENALNPETDWVSPRQQAQRQMLENLTMSYTTGPNGEQIPVTLAQLMSTSRSIISSDSTKETARISAEESIIAFANSDALSDINDASPLREMADYLQEDGQILNEEQEALEKLVERIEQLIEVNEENNELVESGNNQTRQHYVRMSEEEQQASIRQKIEIATGVATETPTRRQAEINAAGLA